MDIKKYLNKTIIIGITYLENNGNLIEQKQYFGVITSINDETICVTISNTGEEFSIPRDLESLKNAEVGIYNLKSTGESIENPDYVTSWTVTKPDLKNF